MIFISIFISDGKKFGEGLDILVFSVYNNQCCDAGYTLQAQIAQLVEQRTENPRVTGSIPVLGTPQETFGREFSIFSYIDLQV